VAHTPAPPLAEVIVGRSPTLLRCVGGSDNICGSICSFPPAPSLHFLPRAISLSRIFLLRSSRPVDENKADLDAHPCLRTSSCSQAAFRTSGLSLLFSHLAKEGLLSCLLLCSDRWAAPDAAPLA
jgi:hypothetical protein